MYFDSVDADKMGRIGFVELDPQNLSQILGATQEPILDIGERGVFDDSGVNPSCIVDVGGEKYLYYVGWQRSERVPYVLFTGLAISRDGGKTFKKVSRTPILDRTPEEPYSRSAPCVRLEAGIFKMWYWSCVGWFERGGTIRYRNIIKYAESDDGIRWPSEGHVCLTPVGADEYSVGRPWVIVSESGYRMWFSVRSMAYPEHSIGYAESPDGRRWNRIADAGISVSGSGWDSQMVCLPCVILLSGRLIMFYNGNRNGETGFGYAEVRA